jgi:hypothetical protein
VEVESDYDPFFSLLYECDGYQDGLIKAEQGLHADFQEFSTVLIRCFNTIEEQSCSKTPDGVQPK